MDYTKAKAFDMHPYGTSSTSQGSEIIPMERPRPPSPPIKVKLKSNCLKCQMKLKNKLRKMNGVDDVNVVPERGGIVTVSGSIDSTVLMEVIRTNYKNAKLLCPFDQKKPSKNNVGKTCSCSGDVHDDDDEDDDNHDFALKNRDNNASISEPKKEKKKKKKNGIMRFFGKKSNPTAMRPPPPRPPPGPRLPVGFPTNGFFPGPPRPGFLAGMPWMPPNGPPPPYGGLGGLPLPAGYVYPFPRSPPLSNPMVHYTSYMDNYRYPNY